MIPADLNIEWFHGSNGFCDVEFWDANVYPSDVNTLIQRKHAVEIIRDLILEVGASSIESNTKI